jgi:hypothetical protein
MDGSGDSQLPFIPSTEVLVKCLFLIAPYAVDHSQRSYSRLILCSHHPCISSSSSPAGVWKVWILLPIFCPYFDPSNLFVCPISEVAEKVERAKDLLNWLNFPQHFGYMQGNYQIWNLWQGPLCFGKMNYMFMWASILVLERHILPFSNSNEMFINATGNKNSWIPL